MTHLCLLEKAVLHPTCTFCLIPEGHPVPLLLRKVPASTESFCCHGCQGAKGLGFAGCKGGGIRVRPSLSVSASPPMASKTHAHSICSWGTSVPRVVTLPPSRTCLCLSLHIRQKGVLGCGVPGPWRLRQESTAPPRKEGGSGLTDQCIFGGQYALRPLGSFCAPARPFPPHYTVTPFLITRSDP